jgi:BCD family chlorophyll transporter-like MFS transporter
MTGSRSSPHVFARLNPRWLPFADAASCDLPMGKLLRLSLFQVACGMAGVMLTGTLNRVMIVETGMFGWVVALMVAAPMLLAPLRVLIGFKSDHHRSVFGWRRVPYMWFGAMIQFGGLAIMPFALLILSGTGVGPVAVGYVGAALGFLLIGVGMHTVQTAGLALAADLATDETRPRVVALLSVMLLLGAFASSLAVGALLVNFTALRLIQVIQGAAALGLILTVVSMWGMEQRSPARAQAAPEDDSTRALLAALAALTRGGEARRLLVAVGLGSAAFAMQDVLLEPYGGQVLHLPVGQTSLLTAFWAFGGLLGFAVAARRLARGGEPHRIAGLGALIGVFAFAAVILSGALQLSLLFRLAAAGIGFGGGLFAIGTLTAAMAMAKDGKSGIVIGAWGAVNAAAMGASIVFAGFARDAVAAVAATGSLGPGADHPAVGYVAVYALEILLLFVALAVIGPLARLGRPGTQTVPQKLGLAEQPL